MSPPSTAERRILERYLQEVDVSDLLGASQYKCSTKRSKREAEMPPAKKPNVSWKRRKEELQRLRALETRMMFLQLRSIHKAALGADAGTSEGQRRWKKKAHTEKQRCQAARDENVYLKDKLQRCVRASNNLQTVIYTAATRQRKDLVAKTLAARALRAELKSSQRWNAGVTSLLESRMAERLQQLAHLVDQARVS
jgi:hypothetical protein